MGPLKVFEFNYWIDVPLTVATVLLFILHFNHWAKRNPAGVTVDLVSRLPAARWKVIGLFAVVCLSGWGADIALWEMFALFLALGIVAGLATGSEALGPALFVFFAYLIREWAFGFPQLILSPPKALAPESLALLPPGELVGLHGCVTLPLKPYGRAVIDQRDMEVVSESGEYIERDSQVVVTAIRGGQVCVRRSAEETC